MTAIAPATVRAAYQDLCARLDGGVGLILGCCGVIADWAGRTEMFEENQALLQEALEKLGNPTIICACPDLSENIGRHGNDENRWHLADAGRDRPA